MRCRMLLLALILGWANPLWAANDNFALYTFTAGALQDPVAVRLDTRSGTSWFFNGTQLEAMTEDKAPSRYRNSAYELKTLENPQGLVLMRLDRVSGRLWAYRDGRWQALAEGDSP